MNAPNPLPILAGAEIARRDLAAMRAFYRPILLTLGFRRDGDDETRTIWLRRDESIRFVKTEGTPSGAVFLRVDDPASIEAVAALARAAGADMVEPEADRYRPAGWKASAFRDPEGGMVVVSYWHATLPKVDGAALVEIPGAGVTLGGYLARPAGKGPFPAAVVLHWYGGNALTGLTSAKRLAEAGYVGLAISLRGWLGSEGLHDQGDRQSDDVVAALRWLGNREDVDGERMALIGYSLGSQVGHLAVAKGAPVKAFVGFFGASDLNRWCETGGPGTRMFFEDVGPPEVLRALSPIVHVAKSRVPVLLIHGTADTQVPFEQSERMIDALRAVGRHAELRPLDGADHLFTQEERTVTWPWVVEFLRKWVE